MAWACSALREAGDATPVLILAAELDDASLVSAVRLGVNAIVLKHAQPAVLHEAIGTVLAGKRAIAMDLMERALPSPPPARRPRQKPTRSPRSARATARSHRASRPACATATLPKAWASAKAR
jgi:DNA-binding NarL/FixJ family response regulator